MLGGVPSRKEDAFIRIRRLIHAGNHGHALVHMRDGSLKPDHNLSPAYRTKGNEDCVVRHDVDLLCRYVDSPGIRFPVIDRY